MELQKIDKRTKEWKESQQESVTSTEDKIMGVPTTTAVFHRTVQSFGSNGIVGEPETAFYAPGTGAKPSRTAEMYYTPDGLICKQKYGTTIVPLANVVFARIK